MSINFSVRFADNVPELKQHLAEGLNQIEVTRAAVDKLAKSLSGENVIKSAHNWTAAINQMGGAGGVLAGVAKLTSAELERANTAIDRAVQKYTLLGQAVPTPIAELQKLITTQLAASSATEKTTKALDAMAAGLSKAGKTSQASITLIGGMSASGAEAAKKLADVGAAAEKSAHSAGILGGAFQQMFAAFTVSNLVDKAVGSIVDFGRNAFETAGSLVDLSNKTGLSTETLQRMQFVAKQSGSDMQTFADAAFKMGVNIQEGTGKARDAAKDLGLDWQKLRAASPDDQFNMVVKALEAMEDPQRRNTDAVGLFGKTAKEILAAIVDGYTKAAEAATVAGDAQVKATDRAGDAYDRLKVKITGGFVEAIGNVVLLREAVAGVTKEEASFVTQMVIAEAHAKGLTASIEDADDALIKFYLRKSAPERGKGSLDIDLPSEVKKPDQGPTFGDELKEAEAGYRALTAAKKADLVAAFQLGKSNDDIINQLNVTAGVLSVAKKAYEEHKTAASKAAEAQKKYADALAEYNAAAPTYAAVLDQIGNEMYEGIKADHDRGVSTAALSLIYKTNAQNIENVIKVEDAWAKKEAEFIAARKHRREIEIEITAIIKAQLLEVNKATVAALDERLKAQQAYDTEIKRMTLNADDFQKFEIEVQIKNEIARGKDLVGIAKQTSDTIVATLKLRLEQIGTLWKEHPMIPPQASFEAKKQVVSLSDALGTVAQSMTQLATISGGSFKTITQAIGGGAIAAKSMGDAIKATQDAFAAAATGGGGFDPKALAGLAANWVAVAVAIYQVAASLWEAYKAADEAHKALLWTKELSTNFKNATGFSDELAASIRKDVDGMQIAAGAMKVMSAAYAEALKITDGDKQQAEIKRLNQLYLGLEERFGTALHLSEIIKELGGLTVLTAQQLGDVQNSVGDLFTIWTTGGSLGVRATKELDDVLNDMADTAVSRGGLVDKFFLDAAKHAKDLGIELKGVRDFMTGQADAAESGLESALGVTNDAYKKRAELQKELADLTTKGDSAETQAIAKIIDLEEKRNKVGADTDKGRAYTDQIGKLIDANGEIYNKVVATRKALDEQNKIIEATAIHSQEAANAVAGGLIGILQTQMDAGRSFHDSILAIAPSVDALAEQMAAAGYSGGAAFDWIRAQVTLANDAVAGPALTAIEGYGAALKGLHNSGLLTQDMFAGLTGQISATRDALVAQGKDGGQVMAAMRGPLQTMWELEQKFGYTTDDATQALIDQSVEAGLVGEKFKPIAEQQLEATNRIADAVEGLAEVFGVLPKAAKDAATGISDELGKIKTPNIKIPVTYYPPGETYDGGSGAPAPAPAPEFAGGSGGIRDFGLGTHAVLHGREGVFTEQQILNLIGQQQQPAAAPTSVVLQATWNVYAWDGADVKTKVEKEIMPEILSQLEDGRRGFGRRLSRSIGAS